MPLRSMSLAPLLRRVLLPITLAGTLAAALVATERDASAHERFHRGAPHPRWESRGWAARGADWRPREYWGVNHWGLAGRGVVGRHGR